MLYLALRLDMFNVHDVIWTFVFQAGKPCTRWCTKPRWCIATKCQACLYSGDPFLSNILVFVYLAIKHQSKNLLHIFSLGKIKVDDRMLLRLSVRRCFFILFLLIWGHEFHPNSVISRMVVFLSGHLSLFFQPKSQLHRAEFETLLPWMTFGWLLHILPHCDFETLAYETCWRSVDFRFS